MAGFVVYRTLLILNVRIQTVPASVLVHSVLWPLIHLFNLLSCLFQKDGFAYYGFQDHKIFVAV